MHRTYARLGGNMRTGLEDTFYLPNGDRAESNGTLIRALAMVAREEGRTVATPEETRRLLTLPWGVQASM